MTSLGMVGLGGRLGLGTLSGTIQIEWFDVIVTIVTGYLGNRRLVVPLILPRTCVRLDPGYTLPYACTTPDSA